MRGKFRNGQEWVHGGGGCGRGYSRKWGVVSIGGLHSDDGVVFLVRVIFGVEVSRCSILRSGHSVILG